MDRRCGLFVGTERVEVVDAEAAEVVDVVEMVDAAEELVEAIAGAEFASAEVLGGVDESVVPVAAVFVLVNVAVEATEGFEACEGPEG